MATDVTMGFEDYLFKLMLTPLQDSYKLKRIKPEHTQVVLEGGAGRYRRDIVGATQKITVKWALDAEDYMYIWCFFRVFVDSVRKFRIDLIVEDEGLVECFAYYIPDSFELDKNVATNYWCKATLEVITPEYDLELDYIYVYIREVFGKDWRKWFDLLQIIINEKFPVAMPYPPKPGNLTLPIPPPGFTIV